MGTALHIIKQIDVRQSWHSIIFRSLAVTPGWLFNWLTLERWNDWLLLSSRFAWVVIVFIIIIIIVILTLFYKAILNVAFRFSRRF